jgi:hypothetical protein
MAAEARRSAKEVADAALLGLDEGASDADRALAIRTAMEAYGYFSDDEIEETITAAGYKAGGRVGLESGGGLGAIARGMQQRKGESQDLDLMTIKATLNQVYTNNDDGERGGYEAVMEFMEENPEYKVRVLENIIGDQGNKIMVAPIEKEPVNILDQDGIKTIMVGDGIELITPENKAKGGRVGFRFGGIDAAIDKVEDESIKESVKMIADMPDMDLMDLIEEFEITFKRKPMNMEELKQFYRENYEMESPVRMREKIKEKVTVEAKDGGIMKAKRGLVNEPGGYAGELAPPLDNKIEGFNKKMIEEFLQGNLPEFEGELVSDRYNRPNFTDVDAVLKIIEMGGSFDDVRNVLNIDITDERIKDFIRFDQENKARDEGSMKDGGLMNLGGKEMDLRGGGFVPIGKKERADDVPARLSKNEFVMTADAVRAAGGGSVNEGAKRMYKVMNDLEARA